MAGKPLAQVGVVQRGRRRVGGERGEAAGGDRQLVGRGEGVDEVVAAGRAVEREEASASRSVRRQEPDGERREVAGDVGEVLGGGDGQDLLTELQRVELTEEFLLQIGGALVEAVEDDGEVGAGVGGGGEEIGPAGGGVGGDGLGEEEGMASGHILVSPAPDHQVAPAGQLRRPVTGEMALAGATGADQPDPAAGLRQVQQGQRLGAPAVDLDRKRGERWQVEGNAGQETTAVVVEKGAACFEGPVCWREMLGREQTEVADEVLPLRGGPGDGGAGGLQPLEEVGESDHLDMGKAGDL